MIISKLNNKILTRRHNMNINKQTNGQMRYCVFITKNRCLEFCLCILCFTLVLNSFNILWCVIFFKYVKKQEGKATGTRSLASKLAHVSRSPLPHAPFLYDEKKLKWCTSGTHNTLNMCDIKFIRLYHSRKHNQCCHWNIGFNIFFYTRNAWIQKL